MRCAEVCTQPAAPPPHPFLALPPHRCAPPLTSTQVCTQPAAPPPPSPPGLTSTQVCTPPPYLHTSVHPVCSPPNPLLTLPPHRCAPPLPPHRCAPPLTSTQVCTQPATPPIPSWPYLHTGVHPPYLHRGMHPACCPSPQSPPGLTSTQVCTPPYLHRDVHPACSPPPIPSLPYLHTGVHPACSPPSPGRTSTQVWTQPAAPPPITPWPYLHTGVHPSCRPPLPLLALPPHRCAPSLQTPPPSPTQMCTQPADPPPPCLTFTTPHRCAPSLQTPPPFPLLALPPHRCAPSLQTPPSPPPPPFLSALPPQRCAPTAEGWRGCSQRGVSEEHHPLAASLSTGSTPGKLLELLVSHGLLKTATQKTNHHANTTHSSRLSSKPTPHSDSCRVPQAGNLYRHAAPSWLVECKFFWVLCLTQTVFSSKWS